MQFELTKEFLDSFRKAIESDDKNFLIEVMAELHPADIAEIMDVISLEEAQYVYVLLEGDKASDVLVEIPEDDRKRFLSGLPSEIIARQYIEYMDSDDAADVLGELPDEKKDEVISYIEDIQQAGEIVDLLSYDEDSAGGIMAKELVAVNENWSVQTCLKEISLQAEDIDEIYYVYVVDNDEKLKGILSLKKLIQYSTSTAISNIYTRDIISINTDAPSEEVAQTMQKYDLVALPVVDQIGRLKGRITIDDVVDIIREEAEKDYQMATGISSDVEITDTVWHISKARLPWLFIGLLGGILGAFVIGSHEEALSYIPQMALFIPLIGAMAGNVGVQSSSIVVQSLASGVQDFQSISGKLFKELGVALIAAFALASLIFLFNFLFYDSLALTLAVSVSLFIVIIFASMFGTIIPLLLDRLKIDPALATGPFITTLNDIFGLLIYMVIGKMFYGLLV